MNDKNSRNSDDCASKPGRCTFALALLAVIAFSVVVKLPSLQFPRTEPDEVVYWSLAENLAEKGEYTLRGTAVLDDLAPQMYDRKLFHHPPLFPALLVPFVEKMDEDGKRWAIVVPWIGHFLCILAAAIFGRYALCGPRPFPRGLFLIPLLGIALDPYLTFFSRKLWMDTLLAGLVALALALFFAACRTRRRRTFLVAGGIALGLAGLTKVTGLLAAPVALLLFVAALKTSRERIAACLYGGIPALIVVAPWFVWFYGSYGMLTPDWIKPDDWLLKNYPLMREMAERPWWFYEKQILLAQPVAVLCVAACLLRPGRLGGAVFVLPLAGIAVFLAALTFLGCTGYGFNMRFIAPLYPFVYFLLYALFAGARAKEDGQPCPGFTFLSVLCLLYGAVGAGVFLIFQCDEMNSILQLTRIVE